MEIYSYKYSIPYFIFLLYLLILMFIEFDRIKKEQEITIIRQLTIIGFVFFFGLRGFVGTDWHNYYPFFNKIGTFCKEGTIISFSSEKGFILYTFIAKSIHSNYFFYLFISSLIDVFLLHIIFKRYSKYYVLAFIVFLAFNGFIMEINLMRNFKSILLFLLSIKYLQQRRIMPYMLLNLLGISFHISSIIFLPLYFILHREIPKIWLWLMFGIGVTIFLFQIEYIKPILKFFANIIGGRLPNQVDTYFGYNLYNFYKALSLGFIERVLSFCLIMASRSKLIEQNKNNIIFVNLFFIFFFCCFYIAEADEICTRMSTLFVCSYWILFPNVVASLGKKLNKQLLLLILIVFATLRTSLYNSFLFKYDNILFSIQKYEERKKLYDKYTINGVILSKYNK